MKHLLRLIVAGLLASIGLTLGQVVPAAACSCAAPLEWLEFEEGPEVVFVGEMIEARDLGQRSEFGETEIEMTFRVDTLYRGEILNHVFVQSHADNGGNCGFSGGSGSMMVLASRASDGRLRTDGCAVGSANNEVEQRLTELVGPGRTPEAVDPAVLETVRDERRTAGSETPWLMIGGGLALVVILAVGLIAVVRSDPAN